MRVLISHPTGNANVRAVVNGLYRDDSLQAFYTTVATFPKSLSGYLSHLPGLSELKRRSYDPFLQEYTHTHPVKEMLRLFLNKAKVKRLTGHETAPFSVDSVYREFDRYVAGQLRKEKPDAVYAYEDGALSIFRKAKEQGITCIYDLPIAYWQVLRTLLLEEAERMPAWTKTLGGGITDSAEKLERKTKELELADVIVGPGNFVLNSLPEWAKGKKVIMSPFGTPAIGNNNILKNEAEITLNSKKTLRVLFVGSMGQRKGLGDLFEAVQLLNTSAIELVVMGSLLDDMEFYKKQLPSFTYEPPRPHSKVLELMRSCDVFCLPSIVEGRALVMQEAMSQGLPIIITANTGGEDLVIEGKTGFLVPIRSPQLIAEKINWFLENRSQIKDMGNAARMHAITYTWDAYAKKVVDNIKAF